MTAGDGIGPYRVLDKLGEGGMGEVYRARDTRLQRDVALKVLPDGVGADPERNSRFQREARVLAALNHPHIAAIYGLEDTTATPVLVMELVEGEDFAHRLVRGAIPVADALVLAAQVADALDAAHERGIVHRDLKPANIKLRHDGTIKVLDFGLARMFGDGGNDDGLAEKRLANSPTFTGLAAITSAGMLLGTAAYMSPEQARGQTVDARTDLWAFGCVLFEMLTGARAFAGDTVTDILAAIVKEEPRWNDLPAETPAAIRRLLRRCLHKDRKRRLASAADARFEIEEVLTGRGDPAPDMPVASRRSPLALALGFAAALAAVAGAYVLGGRTATVSSTPARVTRFVVHAPPDTQIVSGHREVALSPDSQQVAFIARGADNQHVYVRRLDDLTPRQIEGTDGARDLAFSPDGRWLAFHAGNQIRKVSLAGGAPAVLAEAAHSHGIAWHAGEDAIYFAPNQASPLWKVAAGGGSPAVPVTTLDTTRGERSHAWPLFSPDGRTLVFTVGGNSPDFDDTSVSILPLATSARQSWRTGGGAFALTDAGELLAVRGRSVMGARYRDGQLSSAEVIDGAAAIREGDSGVVALSRGGTLAYVPSPDPKRRSLVWVAADGSQTDAGFGQREFGAVSLGPDGRRVAVSIGGGPDAALYLADAAGGPLTMLVKPPSWGTSWSPDGRWIAGNVRLPNAPTGALSRIAAENGRTWETVLTSESDEAVLPEWTPDGRALIFTLRESLTGRRSVAMLAIDSSPRKASVIVDSVENHLVQLPAISPDGRWLAYESNELGRAEVYVQSYPSSSVRVQVSRAGGSRPMWTKRGDAIYFVAGSAILSSAVTTQPTLSVGVPRVIVNDPWLVLAGAGSKPFDLDPDGRILGIREDDSIRSDHIVVVQNWLSEIRRAAVRNESAGSQ